MISVRHVMIGAFSMALVACTISTPTPQAPTATSVAAPTAQLTPTVAPPQTEAPAATAVAATTVPPAATSLPPTQAPEPSATIAATATRILPTATRVPPTPTRPAPTATRAPPTPAPTAVPAVAGGTVPIWQRQLKAQVTPIQAFPVALRPSTVIGNPNAPVYFVEYSDFLCDQCFYFKRDVWPQLYANYIATGKVVATYKYWQVRGTSSLYVAQVAECVAQQGKFWQFHDVLYRTWSMASGSFSEQALQDDARSLGLDMNRFNDCVGANRTEATVRADWSEAQRLSRGVPVVIINDEMVWGNQPYAVYAEVIERKLRKE